MYRYDPGNIYDRDDSNSIDEPYLYSPISEADIGTRYTEHDIQDIQFQDVQSSVPFYGETTNKAVYTWKVPNGNANLKKAEGEYGKSIIPEKVPFYSETTHRSQYVAHDPSIRRTKISKRNQITPTNVSFATDTTYKSFYPALSFSNRQKTIFTCPSEKLIHNAEILRYRELSWWNKVLNWFQECKNPKWSFFHTFKFFEH